MPRKTVFRKVKMDEREGLSDSEIDEGYILTCQSHPLTDDVKLEYVKNYSYIFNQIIVTFTKEVFVLQFSKGSFFTSSIDSFIPGIDNKYMVS
ncbi:MAG: hypothetical protein R2942_08605 [Ignavibacteria bacterium]